MSASVRHRTGGFPFWLAVLILIVTVGVIAVLIFSGLNAQGNTGSTTPQPTSMTADNQATQSPTSSDKTLGVESPGCVNKVRWAETTQVGNTPDMDPVKDQDQTVPCDGMYRVINYWTVQSSDPSVSGEHKLLISLDQHVVLKGGGGSMWPYIHSGEALGNFQANPNKEVTLDQLVSLGLATVTGGSTPSGPQATSMPSGDSGQPTPQDGCTTTNKQTTPDELVEAGTLAPLNILHRIDSFGYSGWSLTEFYTLVSDKSAIGAHRVPTIGYVGQPRAELNGLVGIWFGEGSAWDYGDNGAQCNKDFALKWATFYAVSGAIEPGRLDNGNSGVVVTMDDCKLYNNRPDLGWNHDNIQALLNEHLANMVTFPCLSLTDATGGSTYTVTPSGHDLRSSDSSLPNGPDSGQCGQTRASDNHPSVNNGPVWHITTSANEVAVVNFWSNWTNPNYPFVKFQLAPNSDVTLKGGGDATFFSANCQDAITQAMANLASNQKVVDLSDIPSKYKK